MARLSLHRIPAADGYVIECSLYEPFDRREPDSVVVVNSGAGIPRTVYESFASWLADCGMTTITYDYRGIGGSRGDSIRGLEASIHDWGSKDCAAILLWMRGRFPKAAIHVVAHSIGGIVTGFVRNPPEIDRMVLVSPHIGYWGDYAKRSRWQMFVRWHLMMPAVTRMAGYFPGRKLGLPEDLPFDVALEWGRRRLRPAWHSKPRTEAGDGQGGREGDVSSLAAGVLTIRPSDDPFATERAMRRVMEFFAHCRFSDFPIVVAGGERPVGHLGFFSKASREGAWRIARNWLATGTLAST
jgi:predicted alpha/beta hydrolase